MPTNVSNVRRRKAFNEGRRSAKVPTATNPYDNPKLHELWDEGRAAEKAGSIKTPIPPLEPGETRAMRVSHNPAGSKRKAIPKPRPRNDGRRNYRQR